MSEPAAAGRHDHRTVPTTARASRRRSWAAGAIAVTTLVIGMAFAFRATSTSEPTTSEGTHMTAHPYVGLWSTDDGHVRQLLPDGRYDEARGDREHAYQGRYWIEGDHIEYLDDTGFTADGEFVDGVLHHGCMVLHRQPDPTTTDERTRDARATS